MISKTTVFLNEALKFLNINWIFSENIVFDNKKYKRDGNFNSAQVFVNALNCKTESEIKKEIENFLSSENIDYIGDLVKSNVEGEDYYAIAYRKK